MKFDAIIIRCDPFADAAWLFHLKLDGFRAIAGTIDRTTLRDAWRGLDY